MPPCTTNAFSYTVRPGDSLSLLAQRFHTSIQSINSLNPMLNQDKLVAGHVIRIPKKCGANPMPNPSCPHGTHMTSLMLSNELRMLWEQHVYWTRMVILGITFDSPDLQVTTQRLLRNPGDFENALKLFYGDTLAAKFAELFTAHLTIAAELVQAAKAGNSAAAGDAEKRWYANADAIAAFFASINPYWCEQEWQKMIYTHLNMTKTEAVEILTQKYSDSVNTFDKIEIEALMMADMMTNGIVKQFPACFR